MRTPQSAMLRTMLWSVWRLHDTGMWLCLEGKLEPRSPPSPPNPIILPIVARPSPEGSVLVVEEDGVDGARGSLFDFDFVAHLLELLLYPGGRAGVAGDPSADGHVVAVWAVNLVSVDVGGSGW